jgi:hypothetical protein
MVTNNERVDCQLRDIVALAEDLDRVKQLVDRRSEAWAVLDRMDARLKGLSVFTAFGRDRDDTSNRQA